MDMKIKNIEWFKVAVPRDQPYLGNPQPGDVITSGGCIVRAANNSIYSLKDQSLLVRATAEDGTYGWGECVTVVAPHVAEAIVEQILSPLVIGKAAMDVVEIMETLYNAMRVRGFWGGFYMDAIAAVDMALWDLKARLPKLPLCHLLGGKYTNRLKAYVSGLPADTEAARAEMAKRWQDKGFDTVKFPVVMNVNHPEKEVAALRSALGSDAKIMVDMHWRYTAQEAVKMIEKMDEHDLYVAEAPCNAEDIEGQAQVARSVRVNVAIGEELRTVYEYRERFLKRCMNIIQPEMGRMGVTQFWNVCQMARTFHTLVMPHGSIGIGVFLAASLHASAACSQFAMHEYQHSIVDKNLQYIRGGLKCEEGFFHLPEEIGIGVDVKEETLERFTY